MEEQKTIAPNTSYGNPVRRLLDIGDAQAFQVIAWPDYVTSYGLGEEHIAELIRMAGDLTLHTDETGGPLVWAPVHAWRALGQLRASEAIAPLLAYLRWDDDDDVAHQELPEIFGMIGPSAIPPMVELLAERDTNRSMWGVGVEALKHIGLRHPSCRDQAVEIIRQQLATSHEQADTDNGMAVSYLIDLGAVEAIDTIRAAFGRGSVNIGVAGDLEDVEIALGLREHRETPAPRYNADLLDLLDRETEYWSATPDPEPVRTVKIGRNEPCPCGSGNKYKKCCMV
jgi:hypothetical protein